VGEIILKQILEKQSILVIVWIVFKWKIIRFLNKAVKRLAPQNLRTSLSFRGKTCIKGFGKGESNKFLKINIYISVIGLL
jgi:hypothetical protein